MSPFKVLMILILGVYSNASLSDSDKECEGNIPCELKAPDHPQEEINNSPHRRARRSLSTHNPCECETEVAAFVNMDPDANKTLLNELLTQKTKQTRCLNEGAKCLERASDLEQRSYICQTQARYRVFQFIIEGKKKEVRGKVNVGCECVEE